MAIPAALIMDKSSYKTGLIVGLLLFACGAFMFLPAALFSKFWIFLIALYVIACGLAFLETGANSFIAVLGDPATSAQRLNFSQAFNPLGAMTGALIGNYFIFSGIELNAKDVATMKSEGTYQAYLQSEIFRVIPPYLVIAIVILIIAMLIGMVRFPPENTQNSPQHKNRGNVKNLLHFPHFIKGVIAQFFYVGAQVGTWSFLIQYVKDYTRAPEKEAGHYLFFALMAFGIGRFASTALMRKFKPDKLMSLYSLINMVLIALSIVFPGMLGVWSLVVSSFFMSLMFPTIFALGIKNLGENTKIGGSIIIMAIVGGAVWPPLMGLIADKSHSMALALVIPMVGYLVVGWYGYLGRKTETR